jgi:hypothetical protein
MKHSKEFYEQQSLRRDRLKRQAQLSERKTTAQNLAKQGISTDDSQPYERERVLEDDLEDEALQIKQAQKNIAQLFKDKEEAAILLNRLRGSDAIPSFNAKFPKIFRELKSNYGDISADDAYYIILDVISSHNEPLTNKSFAQILNSYVTQLKNEMKNVNNKNEAQRLQDDLMKLKAVKKTYKQLTSDGKEILENLDDMDGILDFVEDGKLNRLFDEEGDIKDSGKAYVEDDEDDSKDDDEYEEDDEYEYEDDDYKYGEEEREEEREQERKEEREDSLIRRYTAADIAKFFKDGNDEKLEGIATVLGMNLKSLKGVNTRQNNRRRRSPEGPTGPEYIAAKLREVNKVVEEII